MRAALEAFATWQFVAVEERAALLLQDGGTEFANASLSSAPGHVRVGKNWVGSDADVAEPIDFLEFYAREALRLSKATTPIQYAGEHDQLLYITDGRLRRDPP